MRLFSEIRCTEVLKQQNTFTLQTYYAVIMGPTLLYLAHLVHQEVQDITFTFAALGGGSMLGSLVASYVNRNLKQKLNGLYLQGKICVN